MLVRLKRNFFLGGHLYVASRFGVEIPSEIDGKPVIAEGMPKPKGDFILLPKDAVVLDKAPPAEPAAKDREMALSEMSRNAKPKGFVEAMKNDED